MEDSAHATPWWEYTRRRVYLDFHMPDRRDQAPPGTPAAYQRLDPEAVVSKAADVGAEALVFYAKDNQGNSYYPTKLGHQLSDLDGRDVVAEFLEACRRHKLRAIAYFQPIRDRRYWEAEPSWRQMNNDDSERVHNPQLQLGKGGHLLVCPLGQAGEAALAQLRELVTSYQLDGVWWDRVGDVFGSRDLYACFCDSCQRQFQAETGMEIPRQANWDSAAWRTFFDWRARALLRFQRRAHEILQEHGQGACLISNYAFFGMAMADPTPLGADWEAIAEASDVASLEFQHQRSYLQMSSHPMLMRALTDRPVEMLTWNNGHIGDGYVRSTIAIEAATSTFLARGHALMPHDTVDQQGEVDSRFWEMCRHVFSRARKVEDAQRGATPLRYAALVFSPNSYTWYSHGRPEGYVQEFMGTLRQLIEAHVPVEMLSDRHLNTTDLKPYRVVVLPDAGALSDDAAVALRNWVSAGGTLFASHQTSRWTVDGRPRSDFALADVFGVTFERELPPAPRWMSARSGSVLEDAWGEHPVANWSAVAGVVPNGAEVLADLGEPLPGLDTFPHFISPVREWGPEPAVTMHRFGQGLAMYMAPCPGQGELQQGVRDLAGPLRAALGLTPPPMYVEAPASVEMIAQEKTSGGWLVHLINFPGEPARTHRMASLPPRTQGVGDLIPVFNLVLHADRQVARARELHNGQDLTVSCTNGRATIELPRLDTSAVVAIEF